MTDNRQKENSAEKAEKEEITGVDDAELTGIVGGAGQAPPHGTPEYYDWLHSLPDGSGSGFGE